MVKIVLLFSILSISLNAFAQKHFQGIFGQVLDKQTKTPLPGATVIVENSNPKLVALSDENETVRYWAAMGLKTQEIANLIANVSQIEKGLMDASPFVAVQLASALSHALNHPKANVKLKESILSDDEFAAYLAIQGIMYQRNREDFDEVISQFLDQRKGQKRFTMALNSGRMYQYITGKKGLANLKE